MQKSCSYKAPWYSIYTVRHRTHTYISSPTTHVNCVKAMVLDHTTQKKPIQEHVQSASYKNLWQNKQAPPSYPHHINHRYADLHNSIAFIDTVFAVVLWGNHTVTSGPAPQHGTPGGAVVRSVMEMRWSDELWPQPTHSHQQTTDSSEIPSIFYCRCELLTASLSGWHLSIIKNKYASWS